MRLLVGECAGGPPQGFGCMPEARKADTTSTLILANPGLGQCSLVSTSGAGTAAFQHYARHISNPQPLHTLPACLHHRTAGLSDMTTRTVRDKFARLSQMATLLTLETVRPACAQGWVAPHSLQLLFALAGMQMVLGVALATACSCCHIHALTPTAAHLCMCACHLALAGRGGARLLGRCRRHCLAPHRERRAPDTVAAPRLCASRHPGPQAVRAGQWGGAARWCCARRCCWRWRGSSGRWQAHMNQQLNQDSWQCNLAMPKEAVATLHSVPTRHGRLRQHGRRRRCLLPKPRLPHCAPVDPSGAIGPSASPLSVEQLVSGAGRTSGGASEQKATGTKVRAQGLAGSMQL